MWPCLVNFVSFGQRGSNSVSEGVNKIVKAVLNSCKDSGAGASLFSSEVLSTFWGLADFFSLEEKSNFGVRSVVRG